MVKWLFWIIAALLVVGYTQFPAFKSNTDEFISKIAEKTKDEIQDLNNSNNAENIMLQNKIELGKIKAEIEINCDSNQVCIDYYQKENAFCEEGICYQIL